MAASAAWRWRIVCVSTIRKTLSYQQRHISADRERLKALSFRSLRKQGPNKSNGKNAFLLV